MGSGPIGGNCSYSVFSTKELQSRLKRIVVCRAHQEQISYYMILASSCTPRKNRDPLEAPRSIILHLGAGMLLHSTFSCLV